MGDEKPAKISSHASPTDVHKAAQQQGQTRCRNKKSLSMSSHVASGSAYSCRTSVQHSSRTLKAHLALHLEHLEWLGAELLNGWLHQKRQGVPSNLPHLSMLYPNSPKRFVGLSSCWSCQKVLPLHLAAG